MKSVEYFRFGLPIINNIPADTQKLVELHGLGIQLSEDCTEKIMVLTDTDYLQMRHNVRRVFKESFERSVIIRQYEQILNTISVTND